MKRQETNIYTIAKEAGVSIATVSRVINQSAPVNEKSRKKVLDAIEKLNYVPNLAARNLSTSSSNSIGIVIPDVKNMFFMQLLQGITLAADLYEPIHADGKLPAIAVCGPFGAVKEQASGLYAETMAERGFLTMAFDPSFTGESCGEPRYMASPDINTEDFQAAVDFLSVQENVDPEKIGIIGICGWGGMALNAAAIDTRIKATV